MREGVVCAIDVSYPALRCNCGCTDFISKGVSRWMSVRFILKEAFDKVVKGIRDRLKRTETKIGEMDIKVKEIDSKVDAVRLDLLTRVSMLEREVKELKKKPVEAVA